MPTDLDPARPRPCPRCSGCPPHRSVLPLGSDGRLLGLDPAVALAVDRLAPALAAMLDELVEPVPAAALLDAGGAAGRARSRWPSSCCASSSRPGRSSTPRRSSGAAGTGPRARVVVSGDGPLAVGMVLGLVQAGVGAVYTESAGTVLAGDLGTGHVDADRGHRRAAAIRAAVRRVRPDADAPPAPARLVPDLVVLADALAPEPTRLFRLHARGGAHLLVRMRDGIGVIGPLVLPGRTACLGCLDLQRRARAPGWPTVAAQLAGRRGRADPAGDGGDRGAGGRAGAGRPGLDVQRRGPAADLGGHPGAGRDGRHRRPPGLEPAGRTAGAGPARCRHDGPGGVPHDRATSADTREGERIMV